MAMNEMDQSISFEEGKPCPLPIEGHGGGLSFSPNGDMLLVASLSHPSEAQIKAFSGKWRAKLIAESEFPSIPIFAVGSEDWLLETPCNPAQQEKEAPGFVEALYAKEDEIAEWQKLLGKSKKELAETEAAWLEAQEILENLEE